MVVTCEDPQNGVRALCTQLLSGARNNQPEEGYLGTEFWLVVKRIVVDDLNEDGLLISLFLHWITFCCFSSSLMALLMNVQNMNLPMVDPVRTVGASVADFDGDNDLDLFLLNLVTPHQFFENMGDGQFIDRSEDIGIIQDPYDVHYTPGSAWGDPDNDGDLDLLVLTQELVL